MPAPGRLSAIPQSRIASPRQTSVYTPRVDRLHALCIRRSPMALHIRDERAGKLAKKLAARRGTTMTQAVVEALQGALAREERPLAERLAEIARRRQAQRRSQARTAGDQAGDRRALGQRVIFVDTSAVIAILAGEPEAAQLRREDPGGARAHLRLACRSRSVDAPGDNLRADADRSRCRRDARVARGKHCDRADYRRRRPCRRRRVRALRQRPQEPGGAEFRRLPVLRLRQGSRRAAPVQRRRFRPHRHRQGVTHPRDGRRFWSPS